MSATETEKPCVDLDGPSFAHMPESSVWENGDTLTAICGARLVSIPASPKAAHCPDCELVLDGIYGKRK